MQEKSRHKRKEQIGSSYINKKIGITWQYRKLNTIWKSPSWISHSPECRISFPYRVSDSVWSKTNLNILCIVELLPRDLESEDFRKIAITGKYNFQMLQVILNAIYIGKISETEPLSNNKADKFVEKSLSNIQDDGLCFCPYFIRYWNKDNNYILNFLT